MKNINFLCLFTDWFYYFLHSEEFPYRPVVQEHLPLSGLFEEFGEIYEIPSQKNPHKHMQAFFSPHNLFLHWKCISFTYIDYTNLHKYYAYYFSWKNKCLFWKRLNKSKLYKINRISTILLLRNKFQWDTNFDIQLILIFVLIPTSVRCLIYTKVKMSKSIRVPRAHMTDKTRLFQGIR